MQLSDQDHATVTAAVSAAERGTVGEIVTIVSGRSDDYRDVALLWSIAATFLALALVAAFPAFFVDLLHRLGGGWQGEYSARTLLTILFAALALTFGLVRLLLGWRPLRLALTPGAVKSARVRGRAVALFRVGAEKRTAGRTGILLYLSLAEHRAELVTDEAIHAKVAPETWGLAMAELIDAVRDGRPGDGMAAAVDRIGTVLAQHLPRDVAPLNELPDRLIEL
ncbi:MAG: hypothetical protein JWM38_763 [Sphingomonas bacterium]|nr:hypothetical protein [Sphingomonas bacterium]